MNIFNAINSCVSGLYSVSMYPLPIPTHSSPMASMSYRKKHVTSSTSLTIRTKTLFSSILLNARPGGGHTVDGRYRAIREVDDFQLVPP